MDCLCAIVSVIRPGAADEQKKLFFTRRHQGFEPPVYPHPSLEPHLKDTYGLLIFEEHILMVAHHFAGMNLGVSDVLRRELVKMKNPDKLIELGYEFRDHALALGRTEDEIRQVWRTLVAFHGYMFNKAHSASYAVEAWHGAWLKARHPAIYMAAVLSNQRGFYTPLFYSMECRRLGTGFLLPDINEPSASYEAIGTPPHSIRLPVVAIKGLSAKSLAKWQTALKHRPFSSALDFARRVRPTSAEISLWIDSGTLDHLPLTPPEANTTASPTPPTPPLTSRPALFWFLKQIIAHLPQEGGEEDLFESLSELDPGGMLPPTLSSIDPIGQARREWELFDFPVTLDPFTTLGKSIAWHTYCPIGKLGHFHGQNVTVCGIVVQTRRNHTLRGEVMQFFTLADATGFVECTVFPKTYRRSGHHVLTGRLISVHGTVDPFENHRGQTIDVLRVEGAADLRVG
jgi:DNA polymerase III alpha subunit